MWYRHKDRRKSIEQNSESGNKAILRKGMNFKSVCLAVQGATAERGSGSRSVSTKSSAEPQERGEFGMGGKVTRRGRFPHMRKRTVRADSHFIIDFVKVIRVWRRQEPRARKAPHPFGLRLRIQTSTYDGGMLNQSLKYLRENRMKSCHCKHLHPNSLCRSDWMR